MINRRLLRFSEVRLLGTEGEQLGVLETKKALSLAIEEDLDLVLVAPHAKPPVCKIVDYGKYKYEQSKAKKDQKKKHLEVKGVKFRPGTQEHDLQVLVRSATRFLSDGHKVRMICVFRPRELAHPEIGEAKLLKMAEHLAEVGKIERPPSRNGREMTVILSPVAGKKKDGEAKETDATKAEDEQNGAKEV